MKSTALNIDTGWFNRIAGILRQPGFSGRGKLSSSGNNFEKQGACLVNGNYLYLDDNPTANVIVMSDKEKSLHPLYQTQPCFLESIKTDWKKAARLFSEFAYKFLISHPPRPLVCQSPEDRDDIVQDVIIHFIDKKCRVLKTYVPTGEPFVKWFMTVAYRKVIDIVRVSSKRHKRYVDTISHETDDLLDIIPDSNPDSQTRLEFDELILMVRECVNSLRKKCQILISAAAEEYTFSEMALMIGLGPMDNKKISDDLRACRKNLIACLEKNGIKIGEWISRLSKNKKGL